jgi:shikimate dehydrogenase
MHNAAFAALGLDYAYVPLPAPQACLAQAIQGAVTLGFRGLNVTVPHKQAVLPLLDEIDPAARAIGAVNTIRFDGPEPGGGSMPISRGYNTDWSGFQADLTALGVAVAGETCYVLGAGGSARAVVYALAKAGADVHIFARRSEQAAQLVQALSPHLAGASLSAHDWQGLYAPLPRPRLIVNTTPVGMHPHAEATSWPDDAPLAGTSFVYDLVYSPPVTRFMRQAQAAGCRVANGLGMLLRQGAKAFEIWTGQQPDLAVMRAALEWASLVTSPQE